MWCVLKIALISKRPCGGLVNTPISLTKEKKRSEWLIQRVSHEKKIEVMCAAHDITPLLMASLRGHETSRPDKSSWKID